MYLLFSSENGQMGGILIGIVTSRDIDFVHEPDLLRPIKEVQLLYFNRKLSCKLHEMNCGIKTTRLSV